jgi:hypothetical protein
MQLYERVAHMLCPDAPENTVPLLGVLLSCACVVAQISAVLSNLGNFFCALALHIGS